ncbi:hypothetical protein [Roseobacter sp. MH60115]|uniref:hypothetical protein n=1 Tax=Roseobacter sp. MH60115 TaxID=2785324 RepID=UPI0018A2E957|nr:hypothetical protein [Roseobacter sp. MH60115]
MAVNFKFVSAALLLITSPATAERFDVQSAWPLILPASGASAENLGEMLNAASSGELEAKIYDAGKLVLSKS